LNKKIYIKNIFYLKSIISSIKSIISSIENNFKKQKFKNDHIKTESFLLAAKGK